MTNLWEVVMPRLDPAMQSGKIVEWLKKPGEKIAKGEPVLVVEGEKTTFEIESPGDGILRKALYNIGDDVEVTSVVAYVGTADEPIPEAPMPPEQTSVPAPTSSWAAVSPRRGREAPASPAARKLAQELGVSLESVVGSGPGGRVTREDVMAAASEAGTQQRAVLEKTPGPREALRVPLLGVRKAVAERLTYSARTAVPVALTTEVDMTATFAQRKKARGTESVASVTAIVVGAAARALESHPELNSTIENDEIVQYAEVNAAVAINTNEGLVAPVVRDADKKSIADISREIERLAEKAEKRQLDVSDLTGGTFTVTNLGGFGVDSFIPTINPPQCAILAVGRTVDRPVASEGSVQVRPIANLTLVFDHRITDGMPAAKFLQTVRTILEKGQLE